jgi:hypothetical protein
VRVEESIEIARLPEEVWDVVVDPRRDPEWCSKVKSVEPEGELRWRVVHKPVPCAQRWSSWSTKSRRIRFDGCASGRRTRLPYSMSSTGSSRAKRALEALMED